MFDQKPRATDAPPSEKPAPLRPAVTAPPSNPLWYQLSTSTSALSSAPEGVIQRQAAGGGSPSAQTDPKIDYAKLLADNTLTIGIGIGGEWERTINVIEGFLATKEAGLVNQKGERGVDKKTLKGGKISYTGTKEMADPADPKKKKSIAVQITVVWNKTKNSVEEFGALLATQDVVVYSGHAVGGARFDFDDPSPKHTKGDFDISADPKKTNPDKKSGVAPEPFKSDLTGTASNDYQVMFLDACVSESFVSPIRSDLTNAAGTPKPAGELVIIASNVKVTGVVNPKVGETKSDTTEFLKGLLASESAKEILSDVNELERKRQKELNKDAKEGEKVDVSKESFKAY